MLGQALAYDGQTDLALEALADAMRLSGGNSKPTSLRGYLLARTGRVAEAREILRLLEARSKERYVPPYAFALVHAGLGDAASAFAWLDKAYAERDVHLMYLTRRRQVGPLPRRSALSGADRALRLHRVCGGAGRTLNSSGRPRNAA